MTDIFATGTIAQLRQANRDAMDRWESAVAALEASNPCPLLGTKAETDEWMAATEAQRAEIDALACAWTVARRAYDAELHRVIVADQGYDNFVRDIEAL